MSIANDKGVTTHGMKLMYVNKLASEEECRLQRDLKALGASVAKVKQVDDVLERLREEYFDAVLVELDDLEHQGDETFKRLQVEAPELPVFVVGSETDYDDDRRAVEAIKAGAHDFIVKSKVNDFDLAFRIRAALARQVRDVAALNAKLGAASSIPQPIELSRSLEAPCCVIGVLPNGGPDFERQFSGKTTLFEESRVEVELNGMDTVALKQCVLGVELDGRMQFACVEAMGVKEGQGKCLVEFRFIDDEGDLLSEARLARAGDASGPAAAPFSPAVLQQWIAQEVLQPRMVDKELVCPCCYGRSTFRYGCRSCGSGKLSSSKLIHHFACAHVDVIETFEQEEGRVICPKCRARDLVVGADFEFLAGPFHCEDCAWSDVQAELVGQCVSCRQRFPIQQALEQEHLEFHVDRLDPLAIVAAD